MMAKLKAVELDNGQWVYMQVDENITFTDDIPTNTQSVTCDSGFERKGDLTRGLANQTHQALNKIVSATSSAPCPTLLPKLCRIPLWVM